MAIRMSIEIIIFKVDGGIIWLAACWKEVSSVSITIAPPVIVAAR
jgi:hypothetical protein